MSRPSERRRIRKLVDRFDHFGFLAPARSEPVLASAAEAAGFDRFQVLFPSTIFMHELGVPTVIFKAGGTSAAGAPIAIELLMPAVGADVVERWARRGVGTHLAFNLRSGADFDELQALMAAAEFVMPAFMNGAPLRNPAERLTTAYFDGWLGRRPLRLEFCQPD